MAAPLNDTAAPPACPGDMQHVRTEFCPDMSRECIRNEYDKANRIDICHAFRQGKGDCRAPRQLLDYCIDRYEFPNRASEKPRVMASFFAAERSCGELGKRLCTESEWVAACEGPDETPFPYGRVRDPSKCNLDNPWVAPQLDRLASRDEAVRHAEVLRLDRASPSGARGECTSGFGVFDLTGNVDEWARADLSKRSRPSRTAVLKGGAWGHVRNACRPATTSHAPTFEYYFIGFRCCADANLAAPQGRSSRGGT